MKLKALTIATLIALGGCSTRDFLNINTNPNQLPTSTPNFVFTNALNVTATNLAGNNAGNAGQNANELGFYWAGQWSQGNGYIINTAQFAYQFTNGDFNYWDTFYDNLEDYQFVINNADANSQKFLKGPAKVMKAMIFQQLVDMYGNIPYTDALKGASVLAPKFDDQKAVYEALITSLDEAIVDLKANPFTGGFGTADIAFGGNTTRWVQFANSLKMRILIRQSRITGRDSYIKPEINKIVTEGSGFLTGYEASIGGPSFFQPAAGQLNPAYDRWGYSETGAKRALNNYPRPTQFLINTLKMNGDTLRLKRIAYATGGENSNNPGVSTKAEVAANYSGTPFGASSGYLPANTSSVGPSLLVKGDYNRAYILMTAAEVQFLLAEAKQRYSDVTLPNTAQAYFEEGIVQSFRVLGASSTGASAFKGSKVNNYDWTASTDKLAAIAYQKWVALTNFSGLEAWAEYRRTNLPVTPQSVQVPDARRPLRLFYPNTEGGSNTANVTAQGTIDVFSTRLFWDVD
ncbi:SusD/RagB family nutrient-binding outer membrane lipoprotein [Spirosoma rhododendri]|uniref:SusD/RagB family nutrient-binding outer membrane lipoprotein n=1 Tax=Spirosoma rhododendri TaxID=2728024 RepID=A0A7L5DKL1_9BACT|nr:SusD/RagB family nutrient-binding outer membrane lipoprotein [Spirosoma rhododendri]QJD79014.1 SusD/RagB family nutrient-binding outer membrane lipoprotein [Spirosoma rhododendri]